MNAIGAAGNRKRRADGEDQGRSTDFAKKPFDIPENGENCFGRWASTDEKFTQFVQSIPSVDGMNDHTKAIVNGMSLIAARKGWLLNNILCHLIWVEIQQKIAMDTMSDEASQLQVLPETQRVNPFQELGYSESYQSFCDLVEKYNQVDVELSLHMGIHSVELGPVLFPHLFNPRQ